jgi:hypothetical protein
LAAPIPRNQNQGVIGAFAAVCQNPIGHGLESTLHGDAQGTLGSYSVGGHRQDITGPDRQLLRSKTGRANADHAVAQQ